MSIREYRTKGGSANTRSPIYYTTPFVTVGKDTNQCDYGTTDYLSDDQAIQAAIDHVSASGGGVVFVQKGTYELVSHITFKTGVHLIGEGIGATIIKHDSAATATNMLYCVSTSTTIEQFSISGITFDGSGKDNVCIIQLACILKDGWIHHNEFKNVNCPTSSKWCMKLGTIDDSDIEGTASHRVNIQNNIFKDNDTNTYETILLPNFRDAVISDNYFEGNGSDSSLYDEVSIFPYSSNIQYIHNTHKDGLFNAIGVKDSDNIIVAYNIVENSNNMRGIRLYNLVDCDIHHNILKTTNTTNGCIYCMDRDSGWDGHPLQNAASRNLSICDNKIVGYYYGVYMTVSSNATYDQSYIKICRNDFYGIKKGAIRWGVDSTDTNTSYFWIDDNNIYPWDGSVEGAIFLIGDTGDASKFHHIYIRRNYIADNNTPGTNGAIRLNAVTVEDVSDNDLNCTGGYGNISTPNGGVINRARNNTGYITEATGTGTINSGATSATITHGLSVTPTVDDIAITLAENPTNTPGAIWVDTIGDTTFKVNCENDPGASNLDFGWKAIVL